MVVIAAMIVSLTVIKNVIYIRPQHLSRGKRSAPTTMSEFNRMNYREQIAYIDRENVTGIPHFWTVHLNYLRRKAVSRHLVLIS